MSTHHTQSTLPLPRHLSADALNRVGRLEFEALTDPMLQGAPVVERIIKPGTRDVAMSLAPIVIERDGYSIEVSRTPFWYARIDCGAPLHFVDARGSSMEDAIAKVVARVKSLQEGKNNGR